jgi:hypothetical protein
MSPTLAARLAALTVLDERGESVPLGSYWTSRPVVLAFVRHFG